MLRKLAPDLIITAAASLKPFHGEDSKPMTDVSEFAKVLDYVGSSFLPTLSDLFLTASLRGHELRCLWTLFSHCWTQFTSE